MGIGVIHIPTASHSHSEVRVLFPFPQDSYGIPIPIGKGHPMVISSLYHHKISVVKVLDSLYSHENPTEKNKAFQ